MDKKLFGVTGHFDGGNPQQPSRIRMEREGVYVVSPQWECGDARCIGRRFAVMVENLAGARRPVTMRIDWGSTRHIEYKGLYYLNAEGEPDWVELPATVAGAVAEVSFDAPVGVSWLSLSPMYNYSRALAFVDALREREEADVRLAGKSAEGREIWCVNVPPKPDAKAESVVFICRTWGCETAGNYMIEGMVRFLFSGESEAAELLREFNFHFLPMVNPDGVFHGLEHWSSTTTHADLDAARTSGDPSHEVLRRMLKTLSPRVFVNLHDWVDQDRDGILCTHELYARCLPEMLGDRVETDDPDHPWTADTVEGAEPGDLRRDWLAWCARHFDARGITVEMPWRGRSVDDMRNVGIALLKGVCLIRLRERSDD